MEQTLCLIGRVVKPHGVRGKIKVDYFGENPEDFSPYQRIFIKDHSGRPKLFEVQEFTPQPPRLILKLKGIETIGETEDLIGKEIFVCREDFPALDEGEYYWFEILGMAVETEGGKRLGTVKNIFPTGANDVYVVAGKRGEIFLPAIQRVIRTVDCQRRVIQVVRMEGLWEEEDEV